MMFSMKVAERRCRILALMLLIATLTLSVTTAPASADSDKRVVKVMTQNMDAGTDFLFFFSGLDPLTAAQLTYDELQHTDFSGRAELLAEQIAIQQPYLISLQEVTLWQTISATGETAVLADQLALIMKALADRHQQYIPVVSQNLTDITAPLGVDGPYLRFLDRNVILARTDLKQSELELSNVRSGKYQATIEPLPGFKEVNGWLSVDAKIRGKSLRFFDTHLESRVSETDTTQIDQGEELIAIMNASKLPVILAGDLNSDASGLGIGPDQTPTAANIARAEYTDTWQALHPGELGLTWPLYLEDINAGPSSPFERIDLIFERNLEILNVAVVGTNPPFFSDHNGVVATLRIENSQEELGTDLFPVH